VKLNYTHQFVVCADDIDIQGGSVHSIKKSTKTI
jgi:hypothetical protein